MLLVSLVHKFIWPNFTLVFTRNGIFKYTVGRVPVPATIILKCTVPVVFKSRNPKVYR